MLSTATKIETSGLREDDMVVLPHSKRVVAQYAELGGGKHELRLFYGAKEISFDEPEFFPFGENLARQNRFRAGSATAWGKGYEWRAVKPLLDQLLAGGILQFANDDDAAEASDRFCPSPLPPASAKEPRWWDDCAAITRDLTGHAVDPAHLELVIPVFRVAHVAVDQDGRQVGEASVFPRALRLDVPTEWATCIYSGTRYRVDRPMNVTALKAMRQYWPQMMAALLRIRHAFLDRFPDAREGWTVGRLERLATLVLAIPTYQLVKQRDASDPALHPVLSSLFRVTDGLRMTMHQMLFVPIGEPALSPDHPVTPREIHDYAERNYSFHSETGVCAGPKIMVEEFMSVLIDGKHADKYGTVALDADVETALAAMDEAFDYGLYGLQAYGAVFSLWPAMARAYENIAAAINAGKAEGNLIIAAAHDRLSELAKRVRTESYLATEAWRIDREAVYSDMFEKCGRGLRKNVPQSGAFVSLDTQDRDSAAPLAQAIRNSLLNHGIANDRHLAAIAAEVAHFALLARAVLRCAETVQGNINRLLNRAPATRACTAADLDVHNLLQGAESRRLPFLFDEIRSLFGTHIAVDAEVIRVNGVPTDAVHPH